MSFRKMKAEDKKIGRWKYRLGWLVVALIWALFIWHWFF
ncbi:hypothetical protein MissF_0069 [Streptococcus phage MissF]|jgi:hypothetical protein|nr:hypothetical protein Javan436_0006 [Streptococcus phage Javan436]UJQ44996.1 hypothetical protein MissF_0069 [Streptococcus phage MissF]